MKVNYNDLKAIKTFSIRNLLKEIYAESITEDDEVTVEIEQTAEGSYIATLDSENDPMCYGVHSKAIITIVDVLPIMYDSCPVTAIFDDVYTNGDPITAFEIIDKETGEIRVVIEHK